MIIQGAVGPQAPNAADGAILQLRLGRTGEAVVTESHGRFFVPCNQNLLYAGGMTVVSINNVTFTTATLGATCTPIIGVWNPLNNPAWLEVMQASLQIAITALQNTGGGPFMWCTSVGNGAISTGNAPFNRKTFLAAGSLAKDMSGVALTGLTNNLVVRFAAGLAGGNVFNIASLDTAAGFSTTMQPSVENFDGSILVPPGGVLALLATTTPVAQSAASGLLWSESLV